jgi:16S rRNA (cytosine967-C5)-methyltransferase
MNVAKAARGTSPLPVSPRRLADATRALDLVLGLETPADVALSGYFREQPQMGRLDRAFIAESVFGVLRRLMWLTALIGARAPRALLLAWLSRVQGLPAGAFEDDDLRREVIAIRALPSPPDSLELASEFPAWVIERLRDSMSEADILALGRAMQQPAPFDLRVNTVKMSRDALLARLAKDRIEAVETPRSPIGIRLSGHPDIGKHPLFEAGVIEVQDEGSQLLALLVGARRGDLVVDFCAGAGGKTLALGAAMHGSGRLYAMDVSNKRLARMKPRIARSGLGNVLPMKLDSENDARLAKLAGKCDRVLVDAPCSGLGTLRRNPDLRYRQSAASVAELRVKQAAILNAAAALVKPGGRLVYATCSLLPEENEQVVEGFLAQAPFDLVPVETELARLKIDLPMAGYLRLSPALHGTDGFFAALMERRS